MKLISQLFGDRQMIANATGCSSIYSASIPSTPYTKNEKGQGPCFNRSNLFASLVEELSVRGLLRVFCRADTEIIGGTWNGHVNTYTVIDRARVFLYDQVYADFFDTPGAFDDRLMKIKSKEIVYLGSEFESLNKRMAEDRRVIWRMRQILDMHRAKEWKKEQIFKILADFGKKD